MNTLSRTKKSAALAGLVSVVMLNGCVVVPAHRYSERGEVAIVPPPIGFVWYDGYWDHDYRGSHWVSGHWGSPRR